jgi:hypothetical protein
MIKFFQLKTGACRSSYKNGQKKRMNVKDAI